MRKSGKQQVGLRDDSLYPNSFQDEIALARERRIDIAQILARILLRGNNRQPDPGVLEQ